MIQVLFSTCHPFLSPYAVLYDFRSSRDTIAGSSNVQQGRGKSLPTRINRRILRAPQKETSRLAAPSRPRIASFAETPAWLNSRRQIGNLSLTEDASVDFEKSRPAFRLSTTQHTMKQSTIDRRDLSIRTLAPFFKGISIRGISASQYETLGDRSPGSTVAPSTFANELDTMRGTFKYAISQGLVLSDPSCGIKRLQGGASADFRPKPRPVSNSHRHHSALRRPPGQPAEGEVRRRSRRAAGLFWLPVA